MSNRSRLLFRGSLLTLSAAVLFGCLRSKPPETPAESPVAESPDLGNVDPGKTFLVKFETTKGMFMVQVNPNWAPQGAAQFRKLVESGFYDETRFFRVVPGFMVQWGINGEPTVQSRWRDNPIPDDPVVESNRRGTITFAKTAAPNSRTTQVFINFVDNSFLDRDGFAPFGVVIEGMDVVDQINAEYGETPDQGSIQTRGNAYLKEKFPNLDYIKQARIIDDPIELLPEDDSVRTDRDTDEASATPAAGVPATETSPESATDSPEANSAPPETIEEIKN